MRRGPDAVRLATVEETARACVGSKGVRPHDAFSRDGRSGGSRSFLHFQWNVWNRSYIRLHTVSGAGLASQPAPVGRSPSPSSTVLGDGTRRLDEAHVLTPPSPLLNKRQHADSLSSLTVEGAVALFSHLKTDMHLVQQDCHSFIKHFKIRLDVFLLFMENR